MILEPEDPGDCGLCYVSEIKPGGPLAQCGGRVQLRDWLVSVDGFACQGVLRSVIRDRVVGR